MKIGKLYKLTTNKYTFPFWTYNSKGIIVSRVLKLYPEELYGMFIGCLGVNNYYYCFLLSDDLGIKAIYKDYFRATSIENEIATIETVLLKQIEYTIDARQKVKRRQVI